MYQIGEHPARRSGFRTFRLGDLLHGEIPVESLAGKVALIGSNAKSLPDRFEVPLGGRIPGVELHAQMIDQLIRHARGASAPIRVVGEGLEIGPVALAAILGCGISGVSLLIAAALGGVAAFTATSAIAFGMGRWIPVVAPATAFALIRALPVRAAPGDTLARDTLQRSSSTTPACPGSRSGPRPARFGRRLHAR